MREKYIEKKLVEQVRSLGGIALKLISPGNSGVPDRLVLLPAGKIGFVEMKAPGLLMRPLQVKKKRSWSHLGFWCIA